MWFHSLIGSLRSRRSRSRSPSTRPARQSRYQTHVAHRVHLEPLEDRRMLSFNPVATYPAGDGPRAVDAGDFDRDGDTDLITANQTGGLGLFMNNGDGTFGSRVAIPLDEHVGMDVVVGDLNADGKLDLIASTSTSRVIGTYTGPYGGLYPIYGSVGHLKVLLGNGDGSFTPLPTQDLGDGRFFSTALGDVNNDGDLDVALSNWDGGTLSVLLGNGNGTFAAPQSLPVGSTPQEVDLADLNGDGKLDLVTTNLYGNLKVLPGNGNGTFQPAQTVSPGGPGAQSQAVGDVNGDGKLDLAVTSFDSSVYTGPYGTYGSYFDIKVMVLLGHGDGTFAPASGYLADEVPLDSLVLADFDGDGKLDIAASSYASGNVSVLRGNGDGTFLPALAYSTVGANGGPADIVAANLNGDAALDIAGANYGYNTLKVFLNTNGVAPPPLMTISDATVVEGHTGTRAAIFTVSLSRVSDAAVAVNFATANGSAAASGDYQPASNSLSFAPGQTSKTITVLVTGDRDAEADENFFVNLSGASGATLADAQAEGTIANDDPWISISDVTKQEGQSGNTAFVFTISLSQFTDAAVKVNYATAAGTAAAGSDFQATSGTVTFASSQTSKTVTVQVKGDRVSEANETFFVNLSGASGGSIADAQGAGTIVDDDGPRLRISDVSRNEGHTGKTSFVFTVSLSAASSSPVTVNYATANGTAKTGDNDYDATSGKLTFAPGQTTKTVTVSVSGDRKNESHESFFVNLANAKGALLDDAQGEGTIQNDDASARRADNWYVFAWSSLNDALDDLFGRGQKQRR